jgi:hypothetical protein
MDLEVPLLYLAADKEAIHAMRKVFAVITRTASTKTTLTLEQLTRAMYPHGKHSGQEIFKVPYTVEEIQAVVAKVRSIDGAGGLSVSADQLIYSVCGARLIAACGTRYELRDLFLDFWRVKPADSGM